MRYYLIGALLVLLISCNYAKDGKMNPERMVATIKRQCQEVEQEGNIVNFTHKDIPVTLVFDERADRMRLISPIMKVEELKEGMLIKAMEANFHSALDARYGISNGVVWAAFIHPLSDLSKRLLKSAIQQVVTARFTFGKEYSSGSLIFEGYQK